MMNQAQREAKIEYLFEKSRFFHDQGLWEIRDRYLRMIREISQRSILG